MEHIHKTIKYGLKNKNYELMSAINSTNSQKLYRLLKKNYKSRNVQFGGNLVDDNNFANICLRHVTFHGSMATNRTMKVPKDMYLFMPLCCGFTVMNSLDEFQFFDEDEPDVIDKMNSSVIDNLLKVGRKNYIVLKPDDDYCDVEVEFSFDFILEEGIYTNQTKRENKDIIIEKLINATTKEDQNIVTKDNLFLLSLINKDTIQKTQNEENDLEILKNALDNRQDEYQKNKDFNQYVILKNIITDNERLILLLNLYSDEIQKLFNKKYIWLYKNNVTGFRKTNDKYVDEKIQNYLDFIKQDNNNLINNKYLSKKISEVIDFLRLNLKKDLRLKNSQNNLTLLNKFVGQLKEINFFNVILDFCNEKFKEIENGDSIDFFLLDDLNKINWKKNINEINCIKVEDEIIFNSILSVNDILDDKPKSSGDLMPYSIITNMLGRRIASLAKLSLMSSEEKKFLMNKYSEADPGKVKIFLSDVLNYLHEIHKAKNINEISFIVNKSCQGFKEEADTCTVSKCFSLILKKTKPNIELESKGVFNQKNMNTLVKVINKIIELNGYSNMLKVHEGYKKIFFSLQCILHGIDIDDPDIITKAFLYYCNKTYPHILDHLKYSIENEEQVQYVWQSIQIKVIIAVLNLFVTDIYFSIKEKNKDNEKEIINFIELEMGGLTY